MNETQLAGVALAAIVLLASIIVASRAARTLSLRNRKLAERELEVQKIFDHLHEGIVILDPKRNLVQINKSARRILGLSSNFVSQDSLANSFEVFLADGTFLPQEEWPSALAIRGEYLENCELIIRRRNTGDKMITAISTAPILDAKGQLSRIIISYRDITRPVELDQARLRLAAIVESSNDAIISKDGDGIVMSWNKGAEKIFGYSEQEMIGRSIRCLLPDDRAHEEDEILNRIKAGGTVHHIETIRKKKNGQLIHVSLTISPIRDPLGRIVGASKIARDITDRKELEQRLAQSRKMEAIGQLTGGIAHDFNNLLGIISGNLDLMEGKIQQDDRLLHRVRSAQVATGRAADLIRRLLAFSRLEVLRPTLMSINESITTTLDLATRILGSEIEIKVHLDDTVPPIRADVNGFENAMLNLFVNARDSMPGGGTITINSQIAVIPSQRTEPDLQDLTPGRYASVMVSDNGSGMSREVIDRAFEPFFTTKERGKGTGLGLAMVYGFFKQSGGTVRIYSEVGLGTTISTYLPLTDDLELNPLPEPVNVTATGGPWTLLLVDDEADILKIAMEHLAHNGYTILCARNGIEALAVIEQNSTIDLLITDLIMPGGLSGMDLAIKARQLIPTMKVIYCSGFPAEILSQKSAIEVDAPLLRKPYQQSELMSLVASALSEAPK